MLCVWRTVRRMAANDRMRTTTCMQTRPCIAVKRYIPGEKGELTRTENSIKNQFQYKPVMSRELHVAPGKVRGCSMRKQRYNSPRYSRQPSTCAKGDKRCARAVGEVRGTCVGERVQWQRAGGGVGRAAMFRLQVAQPCACTRCCSSSSKSAEVSRVLRLM